MLEFVRDPLPYLEALRQQYGPIVGLVLGGERVILVAEPEAAQTVLIDKASVFQKVNRHLLRC